MSIGSSARAAIEIALGTTGTGDVEKLIELFDRLREQQDEITAAFNKTTGTSNTSVGAFKAQASASYDVGAAYDVLTPAIGRATSAADKEAAATIWMNRQAAALSATLDELAEHERTAAVAKQQVAATANQASTAIERSSVNAGYGAYKWLLLSNAIQDAQYGMSAVVNNIPQLVQAFGGSAGLAGAAQVGAVGLQIFASQIQNVQAALRDPTADRLTKSITELQAELKGLEGKRIRSLVEQVAVEQLDEAIEKLNRINTALAAQKGLTADQKAVGDLINKGIIESTGGQSTKLYDAIAAARSGEVSSGMTKLQAQFKEAMDQLTAEKAQGKDVDSDIETLGFEYQQRLDKQRSLDRSNRFTAAQEMAGRAGSGDETAIKYLAELYDKNKRAFDSYGVSPAFRQTLGDADDQVAAAKQAKADRKTAAEQKPIIDAVNESAAETARYVRETVSSVKAGFDERLEKSLYDSLKGGASRDDAAKQARPGLLAGLRDRNVDGYHISAVADELIGSAADAAQNLINEDKLPRADRAAATAAAKAKRERDKAVNEQLARVGSGYDDRWEAGLYAAQQAGRDLAGVKAVERPRLVDALGGRGVPADVVDAVADLIIAKAEEKAKNHVAGGTKPAALRQGDAAANREADRLAPGFIPQARAAFARNALKRARGLPVAPNDQEANEMRAMGQDFAIGDDSMVDFFRRQVGDHLSAGGRDPGLANAIVKKAFDGFNEELIRSTAQTNDLVQSLVGMLAKSQQVVATQGDGLNGVSRRVRNMQQRRPFLIQY